MKRILLFLSLLAFASCDKYDGPLSPPIEEPGEGVPVGMNATIHGRVFVDGVGLGNVHVAISLNNGIYLTKTNEGGYYTFTGLGAGDYVVFITNPDTNIYHFDSVTRTVTVLAEGSFEANFVGTYIGNPLPPEVPIPQPPFVTKAIIAGVAYEDANNNGLYDGGEPVFVGLAVGLSGNGIVRSIVTDSNGRYTFRDLSVGSYDVLIINTYSSTYMFDFERDLIVSANVTIADDAGTIFYKDFRAVRR